MRAPWFPLLIAATLLALLLAPSTLAREPDQAQILRARQSTVFLMQTYEIDGAQAISCVGSGTLISSTGLILTNAHLGAALGPCRGERVIVALPVRLDEPPVPTYAAETVQLDTEHDLAVLQIRGSLDGSLVDPATLNLPFVPLGDPGSLMPGNQVTVVGYPDIGATSVTALERVLTTIGTEKSGSRMAWYRLDERIPGGMSGGGVYDGGGRLIGVFTSAPATTGEVAGPNCLSIQDNTGDGSIDSRDECIPIAAPGAMLRPLTFAVPSIEAARGGYRLQHRSGIVLNLPASERVIRRLFFSPGVDDNGLPTEIVTSLPSGTTSLFLFFDFDGMDAGTPYELKVTRDGIDMPQMSFGPLAWGGPTKGQWYMGTENVIWQDGNYEFSILLNGVPAASAGITIGPGLDAQRFKNLSFTAVSASGELGASGTLLPAEIVEIRAFFDYEGMLDQQAWREIWYLDGVEVSNYTRLWDGGPTGRTTVSASNLEGLPPGTYRLELYIGERLAATGDVTLAGMPNPQTRASMTFSSPTIYTDITREGLPAGQQGPLLPLGTNSIYTFVNWDALPVGTPWTYRWFLDGRLIGSSKQYWDAGGAGSNFWIALTSSTPLPEGEYAVEVLVDRRPMFSVNASVGSGAQPVSGAEAAADEVIISGRVVDALTGEGIPGALVAVLDVRFESPQFEWDESQIWTQAITDREGRFDLPRGLPRRAFYTMFVFAEGYITIIEDFFVVTGDQPSPASITIEMNHP